MINRKTMQTSINSFQLNSPEEFSAQRNFYSLLPSFTSHQTKHFIAYSGAGDLLALTIIN